MEIEMNYKEKYRELCEKDDEIPIYSKDWWLDAVCTDGVWDVALVEKGGQIVASMPYYLKKEGMFKLISMPKLTQTMGPYIKYPKKQKYYKKLSWDKEIMTSLIEQLPYCDAFNQSFNSKITNWLPFYWKGFNSSVRYTYTIENIAFDNLEKLLETDIRRRKRKANELGVEVFEGEDIETFYEVNMKTFQRKGLEKPFSLDFLKRFYKIVKEHNACKMFFAKDNENNIIAVNFLVYDNNRVYYILGGIDPLKKDLGAMDVILYESIKFAIETNRIFDFEGSMIDSIEKYFRSFGAVQTQYLQVFKTNSKLWKIKSALDGVLKR